MRIRLRRANVSFFRDFVSWTDFFFFTETWGAIVCRDRCLPLLDSCRISQNCEKKNNQTNTRALDLTRSRQRMLYVTGLTGTISPSIGMLTALTYVYEILVLRRTPSLSWKSLSQFFVEKRSDGNHPIDNFTIVCSHQNVRCFLSRSWSVIFTPRARQIALWQHFVRNHPTIATIAHKLVHRFQLVFSFD